MRATRRTAGRLPKRFPFPLLARLAATAAAVALLVAPAGGASGSQAPAQAPPAPPAPPPLDAPLGLDPAVTTGTLENGLTYYIRKNDRPEHRVELRLAVKTGSIYEADDQRGLAHLLEHMAFNGSAHFPPGALVSFFESSGARFGPHVNAYTSFDETVYLLRVPTDKEDLVEKGLQALADFAGGLTLDPVEIDKERGVVIEEWRLRLGASWRILERQAPVLFHQSRYADRLPIGTPEVLRTFTPARLRDLYDTWYRPDRMAVVVVGDIVPGEMEAAVRRLFGALKPRREAASEPDRTVPPHAETLVNVAADPEAQASTIAVLRKQPSPEQGRVGDYRAALVRSLMNQILNTRFGEIARRPDAPFLAAGAGRQTVSRDVEAVSLSARVVDGGLAAGLRALLIEAKRAREHGFAPEELDRAKRSMAAAYDRALAERDKSESAGYAGEYVSHFLTGEPSPGIEVEHALVSAFLPRITLEEVTAAARELLQEDSRVILATSPEKSAVVLPSEQDLRDVVAAARAEPVTPWVETLSRTSLLDEKPTPGRVASSRRIEALGVTVLTLSNGAEVWLKPTDFKNDQVLLAGYAPGGASLVGEAAFLDASMSGFLVTLGGLGGLTPPELSKLLAGSLARVSPFVDWSLHGVRGTSGPKDLETAFQLLYLTFTAPGGDEASFDLLRRQMTAFVANREQSPSAVFGDRVRAMNSSGHFAVRPITAERVAGLDLARMQRFVRERYANAADFTFFLVGAFTVEAVTPLVAQYIASLPSAGERTSAVKDLGLAFPPTTERVEVRKGREPKSETIVSFFAAAPDLEERAMADAAASVLQLRLRDRLREELGGTYSVSVSYDDTWPQKGYGTISVTFGSAPENADQLTKEVLQEVTKLREAGPSAEDAAKVRELEKREFETALTRNEFWIATLQFAHVNGLDPTAVLARPARIEQMTPERLHEAFRRYFPLDRYTVATLLPESTAP